MKQVLNVLRVIIFLPVLFALIWGIYQAVGYFVLWFIELRWVWIILGGFALLIMGIGIAFWVFPILSSLLMVIIPYKKLGRWIAIVMFTLYGLLQVILMWSNYNLSIGRELVFAITFTILFFFIEMAFIMGLFMKTKEIKEILTPKY